MDKTVAWISLIVLGGILIALLLWVFLSEFAKQAHMSYYTSIELGMTEDEMLKIMGRGYTKSLLKDNRKKYEWRIGSKSYRTVGGIREYAGVQKVDIYIKDGIVEEVKPYNI